MKNGEIILANIGGLSNNANLFKLRHNSDIQERGNIERGLGVHSSKYIPGGKIATFSLAKREY
jgi:hypothetical protein